MKLTSNFKGDLMGGLTAGIVALPLAYHLRFDLRTSILRWGLSIGCIAGVCQC